MSSEEINKPPPMGAGGASGATGKSLSAYEEKLFSKKPPAKKPRTKSTEGFGTLSYLFSIFRQR